jgi:hypothetical protein
VTSRYRLVMCAYPRAYRDAHGEEVLDTARALDGGRLETACRTSAGLLSMHVRPWTGAVGSMVISAYCLPKMVQVPGSASTATDGPAPRIRAPLSMPPLVRRLEGRSR